MVLQVANEVEEIVGKGYVVDKMEEEDVEKEQLG